MVREKRKMEFPESSAALLAEVERVYWVRGETLHKLRVMAGLSQQQLAEAFEKKSGLVLGQQRISEMERSVRFNIGEQELWTIRDILGRPENR